MSNLQGQQKSCRNRFHLVPFLKELSSKLAELLNALEAWNLPLIKSLTSLEPRYSDTLTNSHIIHSQIQQV